MTPKERAAMQQALEALEYHTEQTRPIQNTIDAITALREALDHFRDATKMVGCAYCNNPLFAGTKCNNCGLVTLAEQAEQHKLTEDNISHRKLEQEPVATYSDIVSDGGLDPRNAAPVRTKDLTDDEIAQLVEEKLDTWNSKNMMTDFARAVIAADREKNK